MAKNRWGYERVILNSKAREVMLLTMEKLKTQAKLAGIELKNVTISTIMDDSKNLWFELNFWHDEKKHTITAVDIDKFESKFVEFLFSAKK